MNKIFNSIVNYSIIKLHLVLLFVFPFIFPGADAQKYCSDKGNYYKLEEALKEPEKVFMLDISMQGINELSPDIGKLVNLECLDISYNKISDLPPELANLKKLRYIKMSGLRKMVYLPRVLSKLPSLKVVDIKDHPEWKEIQFEDAARLLGGVKLIRDDKFQH